MVMFVQKYKEIKVLRRPLLPLPYGSIYIHYFNIIIMHNMRTASPLTRKARRDELWAYSTIIILTILLDKKEKQLLF